MGIKVLSEDREFLAEIDVFYSLIWVERFYEAGDFTLELQTNCPQAVYIQPKRYFVIPESKYAMRIIDMERIADDEVGEKLIITGSSCEDILSIRSVPTLTTINGSVHDAVVSLVLDHMISPEGINRFVSDWFVEISSDINALYPTTVDQKEPDTVYNIVKSLCKDVNLGFRVVLDDSRNFIFSVYAGVDRSKQQNTKPYVVFSDNFDNVIDTSYYWSVSGVRNVAVVITNDDVESLQQVVVFLGDEPSDMDRLEVIVDARDLQRSVGDGQPDLDDDEMLAVIIQRGVTDLAGRNPIHIYDGQVNLAKPFLFDRDFFMGDVVQRVFGDVSAPARIVEIIRSFTPEGNTIFASFDFDV